MRLSLIKKNKALHKNYMKGVKKLLRAGMMPARTWGALAVKSIAMWPGEVGRKKRLFDIGWSDISQCQACQIEESTEKHRLYHCPEWHAGRRKITECFRKWEQKAKTSKKEWKLPRGMVAHPLSESQWNGGHFRMKMRESEKHKSWSGELVVGLWCSLILMKRWGHCMGSMVQRRQNN